MRTENEIFEKAIIDVAEKMIIAAKTAPKGKGADLISSALLTGSDIRMIADHIFDMHAKGLVPDFFKRDAENALKSSAVVIIGTKIKPLGLKPCGLCGFENCSEKNKYPEAPCALNTTDLGIAVGSAVSIAADNRVDNRIMYTLGIAAKDMALLGEDVKIIYGIPLAASSKSPFFDRK